MTSFRHYKPGWIQILQVLLALTVVSSTATWSKTKQLDKSIEIAMLEDMLVDDPVNNDLAKQAHNDIWLALSQSDTTWIKTVAAKYFLRFAGKEGKGMGEFLLNEISTSETLDARTLWLLLEVCAPWHLNRPCSTVPIQDRLVELAPNNAATYLLPENPSDGRGKFSEDSEKNRNALFAASQAQYFDTYYAAGAVELYEELKELVEKYPPTHRPDIYLPKHIQAFSHATSVIMIASLINWGGVSELCQKQVHERREKYVEACLSLARIMQTMGKTGLAKAMGFSLERRIVESRGENETTSLFLFRKSRMVTQILICQKPFWWDGIDAMAKFDEATIVAYLADLETGGEIGAIRHSANRRFQQNPKAFEHDPALCDELINLDSDSMGKALGDLDPKLTHDLE